jgi:hypothetical protein
LKYNCYHNGAQKYINRKAYKGSVNSKVIKSISKFYFKAGDGSVKMNKSGIMWLAAMIFAIAFCGAFYFYQIHGATTSTTEIADLNTTTSAGENLTAQNRTTNQTVFMVPLEKPPFIE